MTDVDSALALRLAQASEHVVIGGTYTHYKRSDRTYCVLVLGIVEADHEVCVIYKANYGAHISYVRPLASWLDGVNRGGQTVPRFQMVDNSHSAPQS